MSTPAELLAQSLAKLKTANRIDGNKNSYCKDNPAEYTAVMMYLNGGARPNATSDMGLGLVLAEDARRALVVAPPTELLTGTHWPAVNEFATLKGIGYDFAVVTVRPDNPAAWTQTLDAAETAGIKLIIGGWPEPYTFTNGVWGISAQGVQMLDYFESRSSLILALFVYNEPYWINPFTGQTDSCGALTAAELRALRTKIRTVWPQAKIHHDIGEPSSWAPGGRYAQSYACIGSKYADQTGVMDSVGLWYYPFEAGGYKKTESLTTLTREAAFAKTIGAVPVWLGQSLASSFGPGYVYPTDAQILDYNCAVRGALPESACLSWYTWSATGGYTDYLSKHPSQWPLTVASAC